MKYYEMLKKLLQLYFPDNAWMKIFTEGGCYWFASTLKKVIPESCLYINRSIEHCGIYLNQGLYDISGKISTYGYHYAEKREISFMEKNYIPQFDTKSLELFLAEKGFVFA